jgi:hypothetical protein
MIDTKVKAGFLTGQTNEQIAAQIPGFGAEAIRRNKAIARTAVMDLSAKAQEAFWEANSDVVQGWEVDSTMDNRVCEKCAPWDGEFNKDRNRLPTFPLHINCRCRVLPLSKTEMLLREEEGPQRRSVVELIEAPSKEEAIALAKAKPGVVAARAYAGQVKVNGKKYWRVAKDIVQKDHPLTMGEFLRQASPQTQLQVLGSKKRVSKFLGWIGGKDGNTPISPDLALKRVVEWKPTVSRQPRLSAEMKLEISKLKSQKELMKKNSEGEQHIVYGYLRAKDSGTAKAGTPYYVGIGDKYTRAYEPHKNRRHNVPVPADERRIRQFAVAKNRAEAERIEKALIARYGRQRIDKGGILLNRSPGGGLGPYGTKQTAEAKRANALRQAQAAAQYGLTPEEWIKIPLSKRSAMKQYLKAHPEVTARDYLAGNYTKLLASEAGRAHQSRAASIAAQNKRIAAAAEWGVPQDVYEKLTDKERRAMNTWVRRHPGKTGADYLALKATGVRQPSAESLRRKMEAAANFGVPYSTWERLTPSQREMVRKRYKRGARGAALLEGLL